MDSMDTFRTSHRRPLAQACTRPGTLLLLTLVTSILLAGCGGDSSGERKNGAVSSFAIRQFKAPEQPIAQTLDIGGRCLIFLELTNVEDGSPNDIDPNWVFELSITSPRGEKVPLLEDPWIPNAWKKDEGVVLVGGFEAPSRGNYQIDITSPNCPSRTAPMVLLPIN